MIVASLSFRRMLPTLASLVLLAALALPTSSALGAESQELTVLFHAGVHGKTMDCGCKSKPLGGLARRAALIERIRGERENLLVLDAGNLLGQASTTQDPRTDLLVAETAGLGYEVLGVGPWDLARGLEYLRNAEREHGLRFVSANLMREKERLFSPYELIEIDGLRVGVISVMDKAFAESNWTETVESLEIGCAKCALKTLLPELRAQSDLIVLYSHMKDSVALLDELGENADIDLLIEGWANRHTSELRRHGDTLLLAANGGGKYLGELRLFLRDDAIEDAALTLHELHLKLPEDAELAARVSDLEERQAELANSR